MKCMTHGDTTEFLNAPSLSKRHLMQHEKMRQKEFLVKSMTHGNPTEFTHALSLEKENENERLPKRLHHTAIFVDHSDQSRRVALWQAWHTAESYLRSHGGAYAAFFNLPHARAL